MLVSRRRPPLSPIRTEIQPGIWLDSRLALWISSDRLLVIADLHWGFAASHRSRGNLVPWWGDDEIEERLAGLIADYSPEEMIWLGDVVHAAEGAARAEAFLRSTSARVTHLAGNHDRRWRSAGPRTALRGNYFFHHGDASIPPPSGSVEVIGHHHPAVSWSDGAGLSLRLPALVAGERRLILPAFSPWAAGTPWKPEPGESLWAVSPTRVFALTPERTSPAITAP